MVPWEYLKLVERTGQQTVNAFEREMKKRITQAKIDRGQALVEALDAVNSGDRDTAAERLRFLIQQANDCPFCGVGVGELHQYPTCSVRIEALLASKPAE